MASEQVPVTVRNNVAEEQYEVELDGHVARAVYWLRGDTIVFMHTEVPAELEGRGIAGQLVRFGLADARARGLKVIPHCPYVAGFIKRHPEYQDLVVPGY